MTPEPDICSWCRHPREDHETVVLWWYLKVELCPAVPREIFEIRP